MLERFTLAVFTACLLLLLSACSTSQLGVNRGKQVQAVPEVPREFRGIWVATVANIDWPSKPGLSTQQQKDELIALLDKCVELKLNAVIFQVRTAADALYQSDIEPWSPYLTGKMGQAPEPFYDPLAFAIEEAHKRGLELHAWFNPYRALFSSNGDNVSADHISQTNPDDVISYGPYLWMVPTSELVQQRAIDVMVDVARRYDVDGIHIDDYFYPYREQDEQGNDVPFPDDKSWEAYKDSGGKLSRSDWRRKAVDDFVERLYKEVKQVKPHAMVGVSPIGIWKPGHPEQIRGINQYESIYADAKKWLNKGWADYFVPQIYWQIANPDQSFPVLLSWWEQENKKHRHVWPGLAGHFLESRFTENELMYQVRWSRIILKDDPGVIYFSMQWFMKPDYILCKQLKETLYAEPALPPASPWLDKKKPDPIAAKVTKIEDGKVIVKADAGTLVDVGWWVVQIEQDGKWTYDIKSVAKKTAKIKLADAEKKVDRVVVSQVSRTGIQSKYTELELP